MRTSTILGISLSLATGVIVGWFVSSLSTPTPSHTPPAPLIAENPQLLAPSHSHYPHVHQRDPDLERAERLLSASRTAEALTILSEVSPNIDLSSANGKEWLRLLVDASANTDNIDQLLLIYERYPSALSTNEHAALAVADALIAKQQTADYRPLRKLWLAKETEKARWMFLDVQEKITDGKPAEAIGLLESNHFNGKDETDRLVRLAALHVINDPKRAWSYLSEAAQKDPSNADIRTFKASVGEMLNQSQTAQSDYLVAVQNDPESPFRREQLADYYLRTGQYPLALKVLQDTMLDPSLDSIWLKTLFWSRMSTPVKNTWQGAEIPEGSLKELVVYIDKLPEGIFWNEAAFEELPNGQHYLTTRQETFWLQLLGALKSGNEPVALQLLESNPFKHVSWNPELEKGLKTLLILRLANKNGSEKASLSLFPRVNEIDSPKQFLGLLANLAGTPPELLGSAIPAQLQDLILSKEAFVIPFLGAGWNEAAIQLHALKEFPDSFPGWIATAFTQALNQNRGINAALDFASTQKPSPATSLLIAELALANNQKQVAFNALKEIYTKDDVNGRRAALILGQFLMEHNNPQDAKKAILAQPGLADDVTSRELLARIAVQEGDLDKATSLYQSLEKQSSEAKSFLARKAYADKEWARARQLTEALLKEFPDNTTLTDNLKKIITEEKKQKTNKLSAK